jgi:hypothetical protein
MFTFQGYAELRQSARLVHGNEQQTAAAQNTASVPCFTYKSLVFFDVCRTIILEGELCFVMDGPGACLGAMFLVCSSIGTKGHALVKPELAVYGAARAVLLWSVPSSMK